MVIIHLFRELSTRFSLFEGGFCGDRHWPPAPNCKTCKLFGQKPQATAVCQKDSTAQPLCAHTSSEGEAPRQCHSIKKRLSQWAPSIKRVIPTDRKIIFVGAFCERPLSKRACKISGEITKSFTDTR